MLGTRFEYGMGFEKGLILDWARNGPGTVLGVEARFRI